MSSRQKRTDANNVYVYRPYTEDKEELDDRRTRFMCTMVTDLGYDIGTKKRPKGTPEERARITADARVVLEALGLLPDYFQPGPEEEQDTTRTQGYRREKCNHMVCARCDRCYCDGRLKVQEYLCAECRWKAEGPRATTAVKDLTAHD